MEAYLDNVQVASKSDVIILSVKPHDFPQISLKTEKPVISFMAGVPLSSLSAVSARPFRAMTNIALSAVAVAGEYDDALDAFLRDLSPRVWWVDERLMGPLTVVIGSGPAIVAELMRHLVAASVNVGVPWDVAREIAEGLFASTPKLVKELGYEGLVERIATPGGTTIRALVEASRAEAVLAKAVEKAVARASSIANGLKRSVE